MSLNMRMDILKKFGDRIRELRNDAGWSQETFAERSGLHRTYISGLERGVRNPTLIIVQRIANAFSISPSKLLELGD